MSFKEIFCQILFVFLGSYIALAQAEIDFEEISYDFGQIEEGTVATHEFVFTNTGDIPLVISSVKASCGCTTPYWTKEPVLPGKKGVVKASYNSRNRPGGFNKSITITSNARHATKMVYIKGVAVKKNTLKPMFTAEELKNSPKIEVANKYLQLGKVQIGKQQIFDLQIENNGPTPLHIKGVQAKCNCIRLHKGRSLEIAPNSRETLSVEYLPHRLGDVKHQVGVFSNDLAQPNYQISISAQVVTPDANTSVVKESPTKITF